MFAVHELYVCDKYNNFFNQKKCFVKKNQQKLVFQLTCYTLIMALFL